MTLSIDSLELSAPDSEDARSFYTSAFDLPGAEPGVLDLHGSGRLTVEGGASSAADDRFSGRVISYIVEQPSEVEALLAAAVSHGAHVLKPAKKGFWGGFSAVFRAPDGSVWKLATDKKKDSGPAGSPPVPTEVVCVLGVADPKASKAFYETLGMAVDRDYGKKFIDFRPDPGSLRLGLLTPAALAKDAGLEDSGTDPAAAVLNHRADTRDAVDDLLKTAIDAGGQVADAAAEIDSGEYVGQFTDPDGFVWKVSSA